GRNWIVVEHLSHDILIIGGGAAGLRAAIAAAELNPKLDIAIVSKVYPMRSHTVSAEGGMAAVLRTDYDNFDLHAYDTIKGSDFLADQDSVEFFVKEAPKEAIRLEHWGCPFSRDPDGRISVRAFGGMSVKRTLFATDKIGFHLLHSLFQTSLKFENIRRYDEWFATSILVDNGRVDGVTAIDMRSGELVSFLAKAVVIATGGCGRIYQFTTNGWIKTGDGMAMAYRAGVPLKDMEMVQYHPTLLPNTGILITEAARGEGGHLLNKDGERFLKKYVPNKMELGPRDILSRAEMTEIKEGRGFEGPYGSYVHLDLTHLGEETIEEKLPFVKELAEKYLGIDPAHEMIPVRPGQHYMMGGVHTDMRGYTGLPGLYAAGEVACISMNGANRLGSNSLTECLVFGAEAGIGAAQYATKQGAPSFGNPVQGLALEEEKRIYDKVLKHEIGEKISTIRTEMQRAMEEHVGIYRDDSNLKEACRLIGDLKQRMKNAVVEDKDRVYNTDLVSALELDFMLDIAETIPYAALARKESRGAHSRTDYPKRDDVQFLKHFVVYENGTAPRIDTMPVTITRWQPEARVY
ncbi:MAG TPA: succinate dehydrogenase/fumarate reductase flavoprotein subunit, partial [Candidatus Sulfotelmatobacter sp.]|nr:succinate dehydrogenase/fumarate reductase flavoprotein subunit [Candidatus Sulfotelmatobacter sp.]